VIKVKIVIYADEALTAQSIFSMCIKGAMQIQNTHVKV